MPPQAKTAGSRSRATRTAVKAPVLGQTAKADLPAALFGEDFHESLVHEAARADLAARRRGTASSLGRGEVAMTGAKAWRQKGTGRARAGALSVPHRRGGGAAFGPTPRTYTVKVNRKARRRALRAALSVHAARGSVAVVDGASFKEPSTQQAAKGLEAWGARSPALIVLDADEVGALKSFRNMPRVTVVGATAVGVADVIGHASLVISKQALEVLQARATDVKRGGGEEAGKSGTASSEESAAEGKDSEE